MCLTYTNFIKKGKNNLGGNSTKKNVQCKKEDMCNYTLNMIRSKVSNPQRLLSFRSTKIKWSHILITIVLWFRGWRGRGGGLWHPIKRKSYWLLKINHCKTPIKWKFNLVRTQIIVINPQYRNCYYTKLIDSYITNKSYSKETYGIENSVVFFSFLQA